MRDFFIYGFKVRNEFNQKSARTYDNEKRRIESYVGPYLKWDNTQKGKRVFISLDSSRVYKNPLYAAWKSKSFTDNDIMLHFFILDTLIGHEGMSAEELADAICDRYGECVSSQLVRIKANEYCNEGILLAEKVGKTFYYRVSEDYLKNFESVYEELLDLLKFYQEVAPLGEIGSFILDNEQCTNDIFTFKHHFIVHTLEDNILLKILQAIGERRNISFVNQSRKSGHLVTNTGTPLKIFVSTQSGRRYVCLYNAHRNRFVNYRLDYIQSVVLKETFSEWNEILEKLDKNCHDCWGVSFGGESRGENRMEEIRMTLFIDEEKEQYILHRLEREGRGGQISRIEKDTFVYEIQLFDTNEIVPWIKTFTGRIIALEGANTYVINKIHHDMKRMWEMYED